MEYDTVVSLLSTIPGPDPEAMNRARAREAELVKPAGSLGRLESLAEWCAAWQARHPPELNDVRIVVFAGNHGVTERGVSAFPAGVTRQMLACMTNGGAAINRIAAANLATVEAVELHLDRPTRDFTTGPAMDEETLERCFRTGLDIVSGRPDLLIFGEMGIGNTTSAAALCCALFGGDAADWTGPGTGLDPAGVAVKTRVVAAAMDLHGGEAANPVEALRRVGGHEIAAMAGAVLAARRNRVPVLLDGFVATAAAAVLGKIRADALDHCTAGHVSAEPGHRRLLRMLGMEPLLDLGMRLGEGTGAAVALGILRAAIAAHGGMATFAEAGVSGGPEHRNG